MRLQPWERSHSSNVGPARVASGPGRSAPFSRSSWSGSAGFVTSSTRVGSPRCETSNLAISARVSARGPPISGMAPFDRGACSAPFDHVDEGFGHASGRHELCPRLRDVDHVALRAPFDHLLDELVKLRRAQDLHGDRARQHRLLMRVLGREEASRESVGADDRDDNDSLHSDPLADLLNIVRGGREELRRRVLIRRRLGRRVDDGLDTGEGLREPLAGDHVHPGGT